MATYWHYVIYLFLTTFAMTLLYMLVVKIRANRVASLQFWEAQQAEKKRGANATAGELSVARK